MAASLRRLVAPVARVASPRHRRWQRLLAGLTLDPDALARPIATPGPRDVIVCGVPRSGTSLVSALLHQPPRTVSVMEPWDGLRLAPAELFASLRTELTTTGSLRRGRLDVDARAAGRVAWTRDGEQPITVPDWSDEDGTVVVKWTGFWRYLDLLPTTRFVVCVREPAATLASFAHAGGRLAQGFDYDVAFHRAMNTELALATDDPVVRGALLYEHVNDRVLPHIGRAEVFVVRYERWTTDAAGLLHDLGAFVGADLSATPVRISPTCATPDPALAAIVARCCPSAAALGYAS